MSAFDRSYWCDGCHHIVDEVIIVILPADLGDKRVCLACWPDEAISHELRWWDDAYDARHAGRRHLEDAP